MLLGSACHTLVALLARTPHERIIQFGTLVAGQAFVCLYNQFKRQKSTNYYTVLTCWPLTVGHSRVLSCYPPALLHHPVSMFRSLSQILFTPSHI